ncbi:MAG TPA: sodium:solute symporter, partial [Chitinophagaceae bacterium]
LAAYMVVSMLPSGIGFFDALHVSGKLGKLNVITTGFKNGKFDWSDQYNLFSGIVGGFFLALSYFGTDQSQVGRYLTASSLKESRLGLLMNGVIKIPMQFLILLIGALVFTFYQFNHAPIFFNDTQIKQLQHSEYKDSFNVAQAQYLALTKQKSEAVARFIQILDNKNEKAIDRRAGEIRRLQHNSDSLRGKVKEWIRASKGNDNDTNYIFLRFVVDYLPAGLVGLLIAIIFLASWGSIAAALNSLSSCTIIDFHKRFAKTKSTPEKEYQWSKWYTLGWGLFCIGVAMFTKNAGNSLIEAVNVLGSLFYGVILGVFLVAFFLKKIRNGLAVFWAALLAECMVLIIFVLVKQDFFQLGFLWLNPIGAFGVIIFSLIFNSAFRAKMKNVKIKSQNER